MQTNILANNEHDMQKLYYSISEVSKLVDEEQHILRYWEKEFPQLNPRKNRSGNRVYSNQEIALIKEIKKLMREEKMNIKAATIKLENLLENDQIDLENKNIEKTDNTSENSNKTEKIEINKKELIDLRNNLSEIVKLLKK